MWRNWPHSVYVGAGVPGAVSGTGVWMSCSTSGRRVTIPWPRGRKSLPTMLKRVERRRLTGQMGVKRDSVSWIKRVLFEYTGLAGRLTPHLDTENSLQFKYIPGLEAARTHHCQLWHVQLSTYTMTFRTADASETGTACSPRLLNVSCSLLTS